MASVRPFVLYLPNETVSLEARVVSCEPEEPRGSGENTRTYQVGIAFVEPSASARRALQQVSGALVPAKQFAR